MHILKLLTQLEKVETQLSELYKRFSEIFQNDAAASILFSQMSADETAHADLVRFERRIVRADPSHFNEVDADIGKMEEISSRVNLLLKSEEGLKVERAIETAIELESNVAEQHYIRAITLSNPEVTRMLNSLTSFDCRHFMALEDFAKTRGLAFELKKTEYIKACRLGDAREEKMPVNEQAVPPRPVNIPQEFADRINYLYTSPNINHYKLLEIHDYATDLEIKKSYYRLAKEFHPDRHANLPADLKEKLSAILSRVNLAYSTLINPEKRRDYDRTPGSRLRIK
jgi:rubrerythrin